MWWNKPYVNRRDWILENLGMLNLTSHQVVVLLLIDYMNTHNLPITPMELIKRTGFNPKTIDDVIQQLTIHSVLEVTPTANGFIFSIDKLFKDGISYEYVNEDIFTVFENELARPLSQVELEKLNSWLGMYSQDEIVSALRTAIVYGKVAFPYINSILMNNRKEKGLV